MQTTSVAKQRWWKPNTGRLRSILLFLNWVIPPLLILLAVAYQMGPAQWIHDNLGFSYHMFAETTVFAFIGPLLAAVVIYLFRRWLEERDTSDLQVKLLEQARTKTEQSHRLNDDALQVLFAAGVMIDTLKASHPGLPEEMRERVDATEDALQKAVEQLRGHLLNSDLA